MSDLFSKRWISSMSSGCRLAISRHRRRNSRPSKSSINPTLSLLFTSSMASLIPMSKMSVKSWMSFPWKETSQSLFLVCASLWRATPPFCLTSAAIWSSLRWKPGRAKVYNSGICLWKSINWRRKIYLGLSIWTIPCSASFCSWSKLTQR